MPFYTTDQGESRALFEGINARIFWGEKVMLAVVDIAPNGVVPPHSHPHEQAGMVLEGDMTITIEGETKLLKPGDAYVVPGNAVHEVVGGDQPCKVLDIFSPVREEYKR